MAKTANDLLNELAHKGLVADDVLTSLRAQVAKSARPVPPQSVAKVLVEKGHLTAAQAQKLLAAPPASSSHVEIGLAELAESAPVATAKPAAAVKSTPAKAAQPKPAPSKPAQHKPAAATLPITNDLTPLDALEPLDAMSELQPLDAVDEPLEEIAAPREALADPLGAAATLSRPSASPLAAPAKAQRPPRSAATMILLIANGLALVALLGAIGFAFYPRATGRAEFEQAEAEYTAKNFAAAVEQYDALLARFPQHPQAGLAHVHRGLAQLQGAAGGAPEPAVVQKVLNEIGGLPELAGAQAELAPLVCKLAIAATERAAAERSPEQIAAARAALDLADDGRFVPGNLRPWQQLAAARESLALAEQQRVNSAQATKAEAALREAVAKKDLAAAHAARVELLSLDPQRAKDGLWQSLGKELAAAALAAVAPGELPGQPATAESSSPTVALPAAASPGATLVAAARGVIYGLDAARGELLWRRPIGGLAQCARAGQAADADVIAVDAASSEVLRLGVRRGDLKWRRAIKGPLLAPPLVSGSLTYVAARSGLVVALDSASGQTKAAIQLPVGVPAAPQTSGGQVLIAGDLLYVFSLDANSLSPQSAWFSGQDAGGIVVPPLALPKHTAVIENRGLSSATLVALADEGDARQELPLASCAVTPALLMGSRLVVGGDDGALTVFDVTADPKTPLKKANVVPSTGQTFWLAEHAGGLIVAGLGLARYDLAAEAATPLKPKWTAFPTAICIAPPQPSGESICCVCLPSGSADPVAFAVRAADGQPIWETRLPTAEAQP